MVVLDSFPFSDVTLVQDGKVNADPRRNESPISQITIGSSADSAEDVAEFVKNTGETASTESPFLRCEKCHYQTKIESLLHKHIDKHSLDSDFQCPVCDFRESNCNLFVDHFATHHNGAVLKCPVCHRKFHKADLKAHIISHKAVTLYDCSMCEFSTNYVKSIKSHTEAFHSKVYKCRHCSLGLTKHELQLHIKSAHVSEHSSPELFAESVESVPSSCRKNTESSAAASETALPGNPAEAPVSCSHCGFSTKHGKNVKRHTDAWHTKEYQCTKCDQVMTKHDLLEHMKTLHGLDDSSTDPNQNPAGISYPSLQTPKTPSQDSGKEVLNAHIRRSLRTTKGSRSNSSKDSGNSALNAAPTKTLRTTDKDIKSSLVYTQNSDKHPHCCSLCDYSSKSNCDLRRHIEAWHDKQYLCKECDQMMSKHDLRLHKKSTSTHCLQGSGSYASQDSGKRAPTSADKNSLETSKNDTKSPLASYSKISDKHRYSCLLCDYSSKFNGNLNRHTETMHHKKYLCKGCNLVMSKHDLVWHKESAHPLQESTVNHDSDKGAHRTEKHLSISKYDSRYSSTHNQSSDKLPYCCPLCDFSTTNKRNLNRHTEAWHEKEHFCKECNQVMFKHELLQHMVISHDFLPPGSNQNQDSVEGVAKSPTKESLNNNPKPAPNSQSLNSIPYRCPSCSFSSTNQGIYKRHTEAWHEKEYNCEECNQLMSKHDLLLHMEATHRGMNNQGRKTTKQTTDDTPAALSAPCSQLKHVHSHVKTTNGVQEPSSVSGTSVGIQSLGVLENIPKSLPESQQSTHAGSSQAAALELEPFSFHKFRTTFSQKRNAIGESHSTGHPQHSDKVILDSSNTNDPLAQQMEPNRRKCEFCSITFAKSYLIKHVRRCAARLMPDKLRDDNTVAENTYRNIPKNPVAGMQRAASGLNFPTPDSSGLGKCRVVLKRLNLDSPTFKSVVNGKSRLLVRIDLKNGKITKKPMLHCSECLFKTKRRKLLKKHVAKHLEDLRLKCPYCGYKEISTSTFVRHIAEHQGDKTTFKCCFCDKPFGYRHSLGDHLWKHRPTTLLDCSKCEFSTYRADAFRHHFESTHIKKYSCPVCRASMNRFRLGKHMGKAHGSTIKFDSQSKPPPVVEQRDLETQIPGSSRKESTTNTSSLLPAHHTNPDQAKDLEQQTFANCKEAKPLPETALFKQSVANGSHSTPKRTAEKVTVETFAGESDCPRQSPCISVRYPSQTPIQQIDPKEPLAKFVKPYFCCSKCSFKTRIKSLLKRHVAKHLIDDRFSCTKCDFKESCNRKFARHWFSHNTGSQQMIECCFCTAKYKKQSCLKGSLPCHIERHRVIQLFDCSKCEFSGSDKYALERHFEKHHSKCKAGGKFMTLNRMSKHAFQRFRRLVKPCLTEQVFDQPGTSEHGTTSLGANTTGGARDILDSDKNLPTPKVDAGLEFAKSPCSVLVPPEEISWPAEASSSINAGVTLNQTDTTMPLAMPCDMDEEYFCVVCKSWISLDDFAIHQQQCLNLLDTRLLTANGASTSAANMGGHDISVDVSLLSFFNESIQTNLERNKASDGQSVELANMEATDTALGSEPMDFDEFIKPSNVAVPTDLKSRKKSDKDVVELTSDADATTTEPDIHITSKLSSGGAIINVSSDSEDSYGSPYCDSELVGEANSTPVLDFTNVIQDRLKNLFKLPTTDDFLPLCHSTNAENSISSEQSREKHQLEHSKCMDLTQGNGHLTSVMCAGNLSYAEQGRSDMANPVEPRNGSILNIPSDSADVEVFGQPKRRNALINEAFSRSETLLSVSGATDNASSGTAGKASAESSGMVSSWQKQSLGRSPSCSISPYSEIGFPPSGSDGHIQRFASTSQPSSDPSKNVTILRFADGQWIISRYVRNTANIKPPSTVSHRKPLTDKNNPMNEN